MRPFRFSLFVALALTAHAVVADPAQRRVEREAVRAFYMQQSIGGDRNLVQEDTVPQQQVQRQADLQRGQVYALPDTSGYSGPVEQGSEQRRKPGRMSPEERRALRRQIDEAGHDIYAPRR